MLKTLGGATRTAARDTAQVTATTMVALGGMYFWDRVAKNYGLYDKENSKQINLDLANDNYMRPKA
ncbi:hypothetical protein SCO11_15025 [Legionella pneumophila serogroup 1]|uniref:hypothetical protein n=1 Tax=Legionella pneumophila TaxID=446 RepID=UPI0004822CB2|nr:hypothetical protein [Legionella pneumophila]ANN94086.1 hypothetical protein A9P85_05905 [Legionella pneumophila]MCH9058964.1 hypothetical protein [Legionella pneumophila serogroup 1]MCH9064858.1 hypothetical protein [Legionella pneumophila serogroup 1]MCH9064996.1 hypothetical protein [Legionella pneumophila serogroup 1]MCH9069727.1 hypothetical protein [Legionella pneumophila serogroup 1]